MGTKIRTPSNTTNNDSKEEEKVDDQGLAFPNQQLTEFNDNDIEKFITTVKKENDKLAAFIDTCVSNEATAIEISTDSTDFTIDPKIIGCGSFGWVCRGKKISKTPGEEEAIAFKFIPVEEKPNSSEKRQKNVMQEEIQRLHQVGDLHGQFDLGILNLRANGKCITGTIIAMATLANSMDLHNYLTYYRTQSEDIDTNTHLNSLTRATYQVLLAIQAVHQKGVVHGDIKPENFLINPDTLQVKLIDFGVSWTPGYQNKTDYREYMSLTHSDYKNSFAVDMFALGRLLYLDILGSKGQVRQDIGYLCCIESALANITKNTENSSTELLSVFLCDRRISALRDQRTQWFERLNINQVIMIFDLIKQSLSTDMDLEEKTSDPKEEMKIQLTDELEESEESEESLENNIQSQLESMDNNNILKNSVKAAFEAPFEAAFEVPFEKYNIKDPAIEAIDEYLNYHTSSKNNLKRFFNGHGEKGVRRAVILRKNLQSKQINFMDACTLIGEVVQVNPKAWGEHSLNSSLFEKLYHTLPGYQPSYTSTIEAQRNRFQDSLMTFKDRTPNFNRLSKFILDVTCANDDTIVIDHIYRYMNNENSRLGHNQQLKFRAQLLNILQTVLENSTPHSQNNHDIEMDETKEEEKEERNSSTNVNSGLFNRSRSRSSLNNEYYRDDNYNEIAQTLKTLEQQFDHI